jgi:hypothetical protein
VTRPDPHDPPGVIFHTIKEMTMTNELEMQVEELRAELGHCDPTERHQIAAELEQARAALKAAIAVQEAANDAEPPQ